MELPTLLAVLAGLATFAAVIVVTARRRASRPQDVPPAPADLPPSRPAIALGSRPRYADAPRPLDRCDPTRLTAQSTSADGPDDAVSDDTVPAVPPSYPTPPGSPAPADREQADRATPVW